jgi:hypothetical protein
MPKEPAKPSIAQATLDLLGSDFVEDVSRYIVPIFADINGAPVSMGTGFLVNMGQDHILVTAAHVLDRLTSLPHYFYVEQKIKRALTPPVLVSKLPPSGDRADDLVDVGVVILRDEGSRHIRLSDETRCHRISSARTRCHALARNSPSSAIRPQKEKPIGLRSACVLRRTPI